MNITLEQLKQILDVQKEEVAKYITRNLTTYTWYEDVSIDTDTVRIELKAECIKAPYPQEYNVLEKYLKGIK